MYNFANVMVCVAFVLSAVVCAIGLRVIVARAKKCWDFGATVYILHLMATCGWSGFPLAWSWWVVMLSCTAITILLGELLCVRYEMADIPIKGGLPSLTSLRDCLSSQLQHI
jgi:protein SYS1